MEKNQNVGTKSAFVPLFFYDQKCGFHIHESNPSNIK